MAKRERELEEKLVGKKKMSQDYGWKKKKRMNVMNSTDVEWMKNISVKKKKKDTSSGITCTKTWLRKKKRKKVALGEKKRVKRIIKWMKMWRRLIIQVYDGQE